LTATCQVIPPVNRAIGPDCGLRIQVLTTVAATATMKKLSIGRSAKKFLFIDQLFPRARVPSPMGMGRAPSSMPQAAHHRDRRSRIDVDRSCVHPRRRPQAL